VTQPQPQQATLIEAMADGKPWFTQWRSTGVGVVSHSATGHTVYVIPCVTDFVMYDSLGGDPIGRAPTRTQAVATAYEYIGDKIS
jgi:hypothetical protein